MPAITVKNIPPDLYERLKESAAANRRSLNSEIIACIEQAVASRPVDPEAIILRARMLREKTRTYRLSDADFDQAKHAGRP